MVASKTTSASRRRVPVERGASEVNKCTALMQRAVTGCRIRRRFQAGGIFSLERISRYHARYVCASTYALSPLFSGSRSRALNSFEPLTVGISLTISEIYLSTGYDMPSNCYPINSVPPVPRTHSAARPTHCTAIGESPQFRGLQPARI